MKIEHDYRRLIKTIRHEEPDRVPLAELGTDPPLKDAFMGRPIRTLQDEIAYCDAVGFDYVYLRAGYKYLGAPPAVFLGCPQAWKRFSEPEPESIGIMGQGPIQSLADIDSYPWPDPQTVDISHVKAAADLLPPGMGIIVGVGGIFTRTWMILGYEHFCLSLTDNPELVKRVSERVGQIQSAVLKRLVKMDRVFAVWYGDDLAYTEGTMASPATFRKYFFPWFQELTGIARGHDMPFIMHTDGNLWPVIDDLAALGVNALHPIEPKAMDIYELKRRYGKKLTFFGNVDLGYTLTEGHGRPQDVRAEVKRLIRELAPGGGYAVASGSGLTRYVSLENFNALREATFEYGQYPIRL